MGVEVYCIVWLRSAVLLQLRWLVVRIGLDSMNDFLDPRFFYTVPLSKVKHIDEFLRDWVLALVRLGGVLFVDHSLLYWFSISLLRFSRGF